MAEELDRVAEEEHRTKSELFREMFRVYLTYRGSSGSKKTKSGWTD